VAAYLLADRKQQALSADCGAEGVTLTVPTAAPDPISSTVVMRIKGEPEIGPSAIVQDYDGSIVLPASEARVHGEQLKYETGDQRDNLGFWMNPADWADWEFTVNKPGKFDVTGEVAAPERASLEISVGDQKTTGAATATGDYGKFRVARFGAIEIPSGGKVTLKLRAVADGWHPLNVKAIRLKPAQAE
jgi:hypothetical protein